MFYFVQGTDGEGILLNIVEIDGASTAENEARKILEVGKWLLQ